MPSLQPGKITVPVGDEIDVKTFQELLDQLNFIVKDIYGFIDNINGVDNKVFSPLNLSLPSGTALISSDYEVTNYNERQTIDRNNFTMNQVVDLLGTLLETLKGNV